MKRATNIIELYQNLDPESMIQPDHDAEQYVELYGDAIKRLRFDLKYSKNSTQTFYITGQSGTGKTTALYFLPDESIKEEFDTIHLEGSQLFDLNDVEIADVILRISLELVSRKRELEKQYKEELDRIKRKLEGKLDQEIESTERKGGEIDGGIRMDSGDSFLGLKFKIPSLFSLMGLSMDFSTKLRYEADVKKLVREVFVFNNDDLLEMLKKILYEYERLSAPQKVLLMIHDFERMQRPELIQELFVQNRELFQKIECRKIISIPVILQIEPTFQGSSSSFILKLKPNPTGKERNLVEEQAIKDNIEHLKRLIRVRIDDKNQDIISDPALESAIQLSGGIVRQYLHILQYAARRIAILGVDRISENDVKEAGLEYARDTLVRHTIISAEQIRILEGIRKTHQPEVEEEDRKIFLQLVQGNHVIAHQNDGPWYGLNPLVEPTVKRYALK